MSALVHRVIPAQGNANGYHILVLHGLGDSMAGWIPAMPLFNCPAFGWIFANAPEEYGPYGGYSWFEMGEDMAPEAADVVRSRQLVHELIIELIRTLGISADKLILMGFSQGCLMVLDQALRGEHRFAGVVGISGWVYGVEDFPAGFGPAARDQRLFITHGRVDQLLPIELVRMQIEQLRDLKINLAWAEYDKAHTLDPEQEVPDIRAFLQQISSPARRQQKG